LAFAKSSDFANLRGPADGKTITAGQHLLSGVSWSWVLYDAIGYVFPEKTDVVLSTGPHTGSWSAINTLGSNVSVTEQVFAFWVNHGVRPVNASYQYIVLPGADAKRLAKYLEKIPIQILANTTEVQAVRHEHLGIWEIVFYSPGQLQLREGFTISTDQPCFVLLSESGSSLKLAVSTARGPIPVHISLSLPGGVKMITFDLRGGPALGASQVQTIMLQ
jgi:Polysaccharide lyase family 8, super-sandwich domain/Polysaccharide lyase family 8, C-terminal beta-sandwich domain